MQSKMFRLLTHEQTFSKPSSGFVQQPTLIDVHWQIMPPHVMSYSFDYLMENTVEVEVSGGKKVRCLRPELLLLALCSHANKHQWVELKWLVDIVELIRRTPSLNWHEVYELAASQSMRKQLNLGLCLCRRAFGIDWEPLASVEFGEDVERLAVQIMTVWFSKLIPSATLRQYIAYQMRTFDNTSKRLSFALIELTGVDIVTYLRYPLPPALFSLYRAIHPLRLAGDHLRALLR
jgi:hypothetical protein